MRSILLRGKPVDNIFELVGRDENSLTFAFGWCLSQAPSFLEAVATELDTELPSPEATILLQEHGGKHGITDVEMLDPGKASWIFEAKVGFDPPSIEQLTKYANRLKAGVMAETSKILVIIAKSDRRELWLKRSVPDTVDGISVRVLSWGQIIKCVETAYSCTSNTGKAILRQFRDFSMKVLQIQSSNSNAAFVVSVNWSAFGGGTTSFVDVVTQHRKYFHPIGPGWPNNPPNYMAFRWSGRLQSIHHVDTYEVITSWKLHFPDTTEKEIDPHFLYHLGPPIIPAHEVKTGNIFRSGRVWAAIDLLLTCQTISEARDKSQQRDRGSENRSQVIG